MRPKSPEDILMGKERTGLTGEEIKVFEQYLKDYEDQSPLLESFGGVYPEKEIRADVEEVKRLEARFEKVGREGREEKEQKFYGKLLEMIVMEFGNSWIPGYFSRASQFDDYKRGADLFLESSGDKDEILRLALDVTSDANKALEKHARITEEVEAGDFHAVKYFKSEVDQTRGNINLPLLVVGTSGSELVELARLYLGHKRASDSKDSSAKSRILKQIENHRFGRELLSQLRLQINAQLAVLKSNYPLSEKVGDKIAYLDRIKTVLPSGKEKTPDAEATEGVGNPVEEALRMATQELLGHLESKSK